MKGRNAEVHMQSVVDHVVTGVQKRLHAELRGERFPDSSSSRWLQKLVCAAALVPAEDGTYGKDREEIHLRMADAWVDVAAEALTAAVSTALVAFEDRTEQLEDAIYRRIRMQDIGAEADQEPANGSPQTAEVPF